MRALALTLGIALAGCGGEDPSPTLAERGAQLARDPSISRSQYNRFACVTCHAERASDAAGRTLPGAVLEGAVHRPSYWGGEVLNLREAVGRCWVYFMRGVASDLDGPTGDALWHWLRALSPGDAGVTTAVPFTVPRSVRELPNGDAARGRAVFARACQSCHGAFGTAAGSLGRLVSVLPRDTINEHCRGEPPAGVPDLQTYMRTVIVQKTRHGGFLGYGGTMPPFSTETLSDAELADIVAMFSCPTRR